MLAFTNYLTFGPISTAGRVDIKVIYDHRVMDGRTVARVLNDIEETLNTQVLEELLDVPDAVPEKSQMELQTRGKLAV